jgi:hypothetical protein
MTSHNSGIISLALRAFVVDSGIGWLRLVNPAQDPQPTPERNSSLIDEIVHEGAHQCWPRGCTAMSTPSRPLLTPSPWTLGAMTNGRHHPGPSILNRKYTTV